MRSEHAHIHLGRNGPGAKAGEAAARATWSSLRRELRVWYRRLAKRLRDERRREPYRLTRRP